MVKGRRVHISDDISALDYILITLPNTLTTIIFVFIGFTLNKFTYNLHLWIRILFVFVGCILAYFVVNFNEMISDKLYLNYIEPKLKSNNSKSGCDK